MSSYQDILNDYAQEAYAAYEAVTGETLLRNPDGTFVPQGSSDALDAFRHAYSSAAITQDYGETIAHIVGDAYEIKGNLKGQDPKDRNMDEWNNKVGRDIANNDGDWEDVIDAARREIDRGISDPNTVASDGSISDPDKVAWFPENDWSQNPKNDNTGQEVDTGDSNWPDRHPPIVAAYENAIQQGLYRNIKDYKGRPIPKAYALKNQLEYFADLSAIHFVGGNYFPYRGEKLKEYDQVGFDVMKDLWGQ